MIRPNGVQCYDIVSSEVSYCCCRRCCW